MSDLNRLVDNVIASAALDGCPPATPAHRLVLLEVAAGRRGVDDAVEQLRKQLPVAAGITGNDDEESDRG